MQSIDFPYSDEKHYTLDLAEEGENRRVSIEWIERLHVGAVYLACQLALFVALWWMGDVGRGLALGLGVLCLVGLVAAQSLRILIGDLYRQFQYREKFVLFLVHVGLVLVVRYVLGVGEWGIVFGVLLLAFCFQAINHMFFSRIYFLGAAMVFATAAFGSPAPPTLLLALWFSAFLLSIRFGHVRHRLETYAPEQGIDPSSLIWRSLVSCVPAPIVGLGASWFASRFLERRFLQISPGYIERDGDDVFLSYSQIVWESFVLVGIIIGALVMLYWVDKKLRRRKAGSSEAEEGIATTVGHYDVIAAPESNLVADDPSGPRERILSAFRRMSESLGGIHLGRRDQETALDYFDRLTSGFQVAATLKEKGSGTFDKACYSPAEPTDDEADDFVRLVDEGVDSVRGEIARRRDEEAKATPPDDFL